MNRVTASRSDAIDARSTSPGWVFVAGARLYMRMAPAGAVALDSGGFVAENALESLGPVVVLPHDSTITLQLDYNQKEPL